MNINNLSRPSHSSPLAKMLVAENSSRDENEQFKTQDYLYLGSEIKEEEGLEYHLSSFNEGV